MLHSIHTALLCLLLSAPPPVRSGDPFAAGVAGGTTAQDVLDKQYGQGVQQFFGEVGGLDTATGILIFCWIWGDLGGGGILGGGWFGIWIPYGCRDSLFFLSGGMCQYTRGGSCETLPVHLPYCNCTISVVLSFKFCVTYCSCVPYTHTGWQAVPCVSGRLHRRSGLGRHRHDGGGRGAGPVCCCSRGSC